MVTTIKQGFETLRKNLQITDLQAETVSERQKNVRDAIKNDFEVIESFLTGSYRRNTMIAPLVEADVDVFIILHSNYFRQDGHADLLDDVRAALLKTYTRSPRISRNGQAVTITFSDFVVDVVPAFNRNGGGYLIPDSVNKAWISTDPKKHIEIWSEANKAHNGDLVPLIKMIKGWNKKHSAKFRSFHLEALILGVMNGIAINDFPSSVRDVFNKARSQYSVVYDPAGYGGNLASYLSAQTKRDEVSTRLEAAYTKAVEAENFEKLGNIRSAIEKWQVIFGDSYFPSYG